MDLPSIESDHNSSNFIPTIRFYVYEHIACCGVHDRCPFYEKKQCQVCETSTYSIFTAKNYIKKELVMMEYSIVDFHQDFYTPVIQKPAYHLPNVRILGAH